MLRSLLTAIFCGIAVFAADLLFRTSILGRVMPVILTPEENAVVAASLDLNWVGPQPMHVLIGRVGEELSDMGVHASPVSIPSNEIGRPGGYRVVLQDPKFGAWISASRHFQHHGGDSPEAGPPQEQVSKGEAKYLYLALDAARQSRDRSRNQSRELKRENDVLRRDAQRLQGKIEEFYDAQEADTNHSADLENQLAELTSQLRGLTVENSSLRTRLANANPCTVWGYFSYPRPQSIPRTRRIVMVSNNAGEIFRDQESCELLRRDDSSAASACFCVGNTWNE